MNKFKEYVPTFRESVGLIVAYLSGARVVTKAARTAVEKRRERWNRHCADMQCELNREHWNRFGWQVNDNHEVVTDINLERLAI